MSVHTPSIDELTRSLCQQLGIPRAGQGSLVFAAILQAVLDEEARCLKAAACYLLERGHPELCAGLEQAVAGRPTGLESGTGQRLSRSLCQPKRTG